MNALTISQVSRIYDVSPRMLRHYEKLGLIEPLHVKDYAYRMYDENAVRRLQQIIILRKLRIPLKQISVILQDETESKALEIIRSNISELDEEISSLQKIRNLLNEFAVRIEKSVNCRMRFDLLDDNALTEVVNMLSLSKTTLEERYTMNDIDKANEVLNKNLNVRIMRLPPFTAASYHCVGKDPEEPELKAIGFMDSFVRKNNLYEIKPDSRMFGFNRPNPGVLKDGTHGYEVWVTIPDDMELPEPLTKKRFEGGMFAVMTIQFPEFHLWGDLINWVNNSEEYEADYSEEQMKGEKGCLEEDLNWVEGASKGWPEGFPGGQLDIFVPVKKRKIIE